MESESKQGARLMFEQAYGWEFYLLKEYLLKLEQMLQAYNLTTKLI